jgi:Fuc2NAc and GlcNAc transferase
VWILATTLAVSALATGVVFVFARRHLLDQPGQRSSHVRPTPRGGGAGALFGLLAGLALQRFAGSALEARTTACIVVSAVVLGALGFADDRYGLRASLRYPFHLGVAVFATWLAGPVTPSWLGPPFLGALVSVIGFTALVNLYNFMDGLDGLVAGTSVAQFAFLAVFTGRPEWALVATAFAGFLAWNFPPAKIFMGDVGSTALGALAGTAVLTSWQSVHPALWVVALPLLGDAFYTILRRLLRRENLAAAHHSHVYQRLLRSGLSHRAISAVYVALTLLCGLAGGYGETRGGVAAAVICLSALLAAERRISRLGVPFTRPVR